jgi:hypothetical protein
MFKHFEHHKEPLASTGDFLRRMIRFAALAAGIILVSLGIGILGYHYLEGQSWIDSLLNASMILGGMGPVNPLKTTGGKLFASFYALFAGMVLLVAVGVLVAPIFHRFLHHFHLEVEGGQDN